MKQLSLKDGLNMYDDDIPADEGDCLNCNQSWCDHDAWACIHLSYSKKKIKRSVLPEHLRYLSKKMKAEQFDSIPSTMRTPELLIVKPSSSVCEWKTWRDINRKSNECSCGMIKSNCDYHK